MKKILLPLLLLGSTFYAQAQSSIQLGPKVGLNLTTMDLGNTQDRTEQEIGYSPGLSLGVATSFKINSLLSFTPEISYAQYGYKGLVFTSTEEAESGEMATWTTKESFRTSFIDMPLLLRGTFGGPTKLYINAGPTLGYWLSGRYEGSGSGTYEGAEISYQYKLDVKFVDQYKDYKTDEFVEVSPEDSQRLQWGAAFGGGLMLPLAGNDLLVDARYSLAFTDLYKNMEGNEKARNKGFSLSLIYLFGL
ncbi:porin family protein [Cesiribacter andamanensis]|uniref:Outer membrane protein beta-barrel domain-containing protein n=1 Tax=Cesiribacter andamanensis AMV16 TaxID=1279009 RepID=M7N5P1_9BACT|nr:porin family protein [Cesiribacter andamanensis]EMR02607.1 hypothetical protein ADICEAN_02263 [Cesiribacter andamanensis AMV16]